MAALFKYKVVGIKAFESGMKDQHISSSVIEEVINMCASDGWEYQNSIFCNSIHTHDGYVVYPIVHLVFRMPK